MGNAATRRPLAEGLRRPWSAPFWSLGVIVAVSMGCSKKEEPAPSTKAQEQRANQAAPASPAAASSPPEAKNVSIPSPPKSLGAIKIPSDNPLTTAKVALGHKLFFDKRLSVDGSRSCYSCHLNEDGTGGHEPKAIGAKDVQLTRHAPVMWNVAYLPRLYWDGRADSLEAQAKGAWAGGNMGVGADNLAKKADELYALPEYTALFDAAFPGEGGTVATVTRALASYERTLFCGDTAYDKFAAGNSTALNDEQKKGWELFTGKGNCHSCHTPPFFSDAYMAEQGAYHNTGMGLEGTPADKVDLGRQAISKVDSETSAFKTPTLRNVTRTAPYFHDGSIAKLEDAVSFMAKGGFKNPHLDPKLVDKQLSAEEVKAIVAFLGALECDGKLEPPTN